MQLKRSFERAISHCDVVIVVVIPELFTNVVCTVAMLLPRILVLSQQLNRSLVCINRGQGTSCMVNTWGVLLMWYTWVSQNTSFGLNVILGPQLVGINESGHRQGSQGTGKTGNSKTKASQSGKDWEFEGKKTYKKTSFWGDK